MGGAKVECHRQEDPGTKVAEWEVCATRGGVWEGGCAPPPEHFFSNFALKYMICGAFGALFSLAGFNASSIPNDLDYLLIFISTSD